MGAEGKTRARNQGYSPAGQAGRGASKSAHPCETRAESRARAWGSGPGCHCPQLPVALCPLSCCEQEEPTYFAIWGDNKAFNEVVISPAMLHEHLPYVVMEGLNKVRPGSPRPRAAFQPRSACPRMAGRGVAAGVPSWAVGREPARVLASAPCSVAWPCGPCEAELKRLPGTRL